MVADSMAVLKVITVGNAAGIVIPKEMLDRLKVGEGDELFAIETPEATYSLRLIPT
jgi:bifunctional DNA-binding transcriptional regulator/antitoxin component of YhaV-PrlF toxin-antitoxin module